MINGTNKTKSKRLRGRPRKTEPEKAIEALVAQYPDEPPKVIWYKLKTLAVADKSLLVSLKTVQRHMEKLTPLGELDTPWSLGTSAKYQIPSDAYEDLLKIKRWCAIVGVPFTIRQAKWVAVLRPVVMAWAGAKPLNEYWLLETFLRAQEYAARERKREHNTEDLDSPLLFASEWERRTAQEVGVIPRNDPHLVGEAEVSKNPVLFYHPPDVDRAVEFALWWEDFYRFFDTFFPSGGRGIMLPGEMSYPRLGLQPPLEAASAKGVYALWLRRISQTETWKRQSFEDHLKTMRDLRAWVNRKSPEYAIELSFGNNPPNPAEVLKRYGLVNKVVLREEKDREGRVTRRWPETVLIQEKTEEGGKP